jgi:UDP:flavonoid glycosyltransferase YjiC (YdhE family)
VTDRLHVLGCCLPDHGHLYPMLPLAVALRDAGHDIREIARRLPEVTVVRA